VSFHPSDVPFSPRLEFIFLLFGPCLDLGACHLEFAYDLPITGVWSIGAFGIWICFEFRDSDFDIWLRIASGAPEQDTKRLGREMDCAQRGHWVYQDTALTGFPARVPPGGGRTYRETM
jgi:hypothetical protein